MRQAHIQQVAYRKLANDQAVREAVLPRLSTDLRVIADVLRLAEVGMLMAVGIWTLASMSHAWMGAFLGFAIARAVLGFGRPRDIANAAIFLMSDASVWITGTSMVVDGGYTAK